jgi:hypothetical protein
MASGEAHRQENALSYEIHPNLFLICRLGESGAGFKPSQESWYFHATKEN